MLDKIIEISSDGESCIHCDGGICLSCVEECLYTYKEALKTIGWYCSDDALGQKIENGKEFDGKTIEQIIKELTKDA